MEFLYCFFESNYVDNERLVTCNLVKHHRLAVSTQDPSHTSCMHSYLQPSL